MHLSRIYTGYLLRFPSQEAAIITTQLSALPAFPSPSGGWLHCRKPGVVVRLLYRSNPEALNQGVVELYWPKTKVMAYKKSDMVFDDYQWHARDEDDDPRVTGEPDSTLLDRQEGV